MWICETLWQKFNAFTGIGDKHWMKKMMEIAVLISIGLKCYSFDSDSQVRFGKHNRKWKVNDPTTKLQWEVSVTQNVWQLAGWAREHMQCTVIWITEYDCKCCAYACGNFWAISHQIAVCLLLLCCSIQAEVTVASNKYSSANSLYSIS